MLNRGYAGVLKLMEGQTTYYQSLGGKYKARRNFLRFYKHREYSHCSDDNIISIVPKHRMSCIAVIGEVNLLGEEMVLVGKTLWDLATHMLGTIIAWKFRRK